VGADQPSHARALTRSSIASLLATGVEFLLVPLFVHVLHLPKWVVFAGVQFIANAISFTLYKYWAFEAAGYGSLGGQYARQAVIFAGSLCLNTLLPSLLSYRVGLEATLAFALSNVVVYLCWNYPGNRYWVFRRPANPSRS
jgi:putative flippase GtrA